MNYHVLLIEDDLDLAATIVDYLALENICCDHAANSIAGLNFINQQHYDVVLLDVNLPRMNGLTVCKNIREQGNNIPVLMLTARETLDDKLAGFAVGSDDYMVKPFAMLELIARIHVLANRRNGLTNILSLYGVDVDFSTKTLKRASCALQLSPTGWKILEILMRKSPEVVSKEQLLKAIWGDELPDSDSLKVHLFKLRQQVDRKSQKKLIHTVIGQGFAFRE
jgi:DNA-binding response OmpR family regulator